MKTIGKMIVGLFFLPFLALAGLIAIARLIFVLTIVFAWQKAEEWYEEMLCWVNDKVKALKQ